MCDGRVTYRKLRYLRLRIASYLCGYVVYNVYSMQSMYIDGYQVKVFIVLKRGYEYVAY
jgi:hypothetical protein